MTDDRVTRAPWSETEVANLNWWQHRISVHPFTCGGDHAETRVLVALETGWVCPDSTCDYVQDWAWRMMLRPRPAGIRPGGVMRCCISTHETEAPPAAETREGAVLSCLFCSSSLIVRDGQWEWNRDAG